MTKKPAPLVAMLTSASPLARVSSSRRSASICRQASGSRRMALRPLGHFSTICKVHILLAHLFEHVAFYLLGQALEPYSDRAFQQTNSRPHSRPTASLGQHSRCSIAMRSLDRVESSSEIDPPGRG